MQPPLTPQAFAEEIARRAGAGRLIVALAGPPGAGKSTLAEATAARLNAGGRGFCAVLPMDGFHYDDLLLGPLGWLPRKGAPHTFDVGGLAATLSRLRAADEATVAVPVFDRAIEIARAGARLIARETAVVLVEGNWLLLDEAPWRDLRPLFDLTAMIAVRRETVAARLAARWRGFGRDEAGVAAKLEGNDLPNAERVLTRSAAPDLWVSGEEAA
jgi:pantothenate kinase